jgi:gamma-glutamyltranspeptidase / glutathione hydrolase
MLAATATMWDVLQLGRRDAGADLPPGREEGDRHERARVAPTGATPEFFRAKGMKYPPEYGPLAAVTPGTPGGLMTMLAEYGTLSLAEVLAPAIEMADGYPDRGTDRQRDRAGEGALKEWKYSPAVMLPHWARRARRRRRRDLPAAGPQGHAARSWWRRRPRRCGREVAPGGDHGRVRPLLPGDIAREFVRGVQEEGGLITLDDLAKWQVGIEEPVTTYKGIDVYKLTYVVQGPVMLQALNILENHRSPGDGLQQRPVHPHVYQAMNLAFADRDFYYGDPYFPPEEPIRGLLSKDYARARAARSTGSATSPT